MKALKVMYDIFRFLIDEEPKRPRRATKRVKARVPTQTVYPKGETFKRDNKVYYNCHSRGIVRIK